MLYFVSLGNTACLGIKLDEKRQHKSPHFYVIISGYSMVKSVNGFFCCVCKKFFTSCNLSDHCKSAQHYDKFVENIDAKKERVRQKRKALKVPVQTL